MIAVISDVHGNFPALKAVIDDIRKKGNIQIISLGDIAGYYCFINECIELCQQEHVINIMGNHDYYLTSGQGCPRSHSANVCLEYQAKNISEKNMEWLRKSKPFLDIKGISMRHGGWRDAMDEYIYEFSFDMVANRKEKIFVSGHTHKQMIKKEENRIYFNPGSVGQPRDYIASAAYALIDDNLDTVLKRVNYPIGEVIEAMKERGFQDSLSTCLLRGTKIGE